MKTRAQYMNKECTHREYYAQFVSDATRRAVLNHFGIEKLRNHFKYGEDLSHPKRLELKKWDNAPLYMQGSMTDAGDWLSPAGKVCILKEAARQIIEREVA